MRSRISSSNRRRPTKQLAASCAAEMDVAPQARSRAAFACSSRHLTSSWPLGRSHQTSDAKTKRGQSSRAATTVACVRYWHHGPRQHSKKSNLKCFFSQQQKVQKKSAPPPLFLSFVPPGEAAFNAHTSHHRPPTSRAHTSQHQQASTHTKG